MYPYPYYPYDDFQIVFLDPLVAQLVAINSILNNQFFANFRFTVNDL